MLMPQLASQSANAAKASYDGVMFHTHDYVQSVCTLVNVDCVDQSTDNVVVSDTQTTGQKLRGLMERAGLTVRAFANAAGYPHGSGVQRYIEPHFDGQLKPDVARRMAEALAGKGAPPIDPQEVYALVGIPEGNAIPIRYEGASGQRMQQNIPILGTALGADRVSDGLAIEQTCLYEHEQIGYAKRPVVLDGRADVYGLYVQGSSMDPAYEDGATILVETKRPPRIGEYAVVYLRMNGDGDETDVDGRARTIMIKKLIRKSASFIELEQFNPRMTFRVEAKEVMKMHRVIPWGELIT